MSERIVDEILRELRHKNPVIMDEGDFYAIYTPTVKYDVSNGVSYSNGYLYIVPFEGVSLHVEPIDVERTDTCLYVKDGDARVARLDVFRTIFFGGPKITGIRVIPLRPGRVVLRIKACKRKLIGKRCYIYDYAFTFKADNVRARTKRKGGKTTVSEAPSSQHGDCHANVTFHIDNCGSEGGGTIYVRGVSEDKWRPLTEWGLKAHKECCETVSMSVPCGEYWFRANCGVPVRVKLDAGYHIVVLRSIGCYGNTDDINAHVKKGLSAIYVIGPGNKLFAVDDEPAYMHSPTTVVYVKPGKHTLRFNNGDTVTIHTIAGTEYYVNVWLGKPIVSRDTPPLR